ncbi:MAG: lytic murein transglycosylase B [Gammaproteobacteria bacterium]|nr:lytic murein transglycosylase B [Gammaproteobacteria bacterium]MCW8959105.1 lytic murein transglycosylase B [Gammaproteobacteria bacterium]MCW8972662.1 lytic murein transglycosylase B [Gammaproteobacteria bacterium]MCW8992373.1 lytic murein transglycosylase B [Gammaproteobacteria bacterium]
MVKKLFIALLLLAPLPLFAQDFPQQFPQSREFIQEMSDKHGFSTQTLADLFARVEHKQAIIDAISRPAESKPWYQYRPIFVTAERIRQGVEFWQENEPLLERAHKEYGVPPHIIVAIIGVETRYGRHSGSYRVMDALSTLAFNYPKRGSFFRGQLEAFLLMTREEQRDPLEFLGSYAGAMGMPQFIPSSFRAYAVDFDNDGRRDLWQNTSDVIGSVANYFAEHKWRSGEPVASRATLSGESPQAALDKGYRPSLTLAELKRLGVQPVANYNDNDEVALIALDSTPEQQQYWVTRHNFYVITRYNHSPLYAMAVHQLAEAIRTTRATTPRKDGNS